MKHKQSFLILSLLLTSCSPRYFLRPSGDQLNEINHIPYVYAETQECKLEAAARKEDTEHSLIDFKISSKLKKSMIITHSQFRLEGLPIQGEKADAQNPVLTKSKLNDELLNLQKRQDSKVWTGVEEIHDFLITDKNEAPLEKSKEDLSDYKKEKEKREKRIKVIKNEMVFLKEIEFQSTSLNPSQSVTGTLIFKPNFIKEGKTYLIFEQNDCKIQVPFDVRVHKIWN